MLHFSLSFYPTDSSHNYRGSMIPNTRWVHVLSPLITYFYGSCRNFFSTTKISDLSEKKPVEGKSEEGIKSALWCNEFIKKTSKNTFFVFPLQCVFHLLFFFFFPSLLTALHNRTAYGSRMVSVFQYLIFDIYL